MKRVVVVSLSVIALAVSMWACEKGGEEAAEEAEQAAESAQETEQAEPAEPEAPDSAQLLIGTWRNDILEDARMTFNSAGRVFTFFGSCLGTYTIDGNRIRFEYDEGQPNCMSMGSSMEFDNDDHVTMSGAPYTRVDSEDVADLTTLVPQPEPQEGAGTATP